MKQVQAKYGMIAAGHEKTAQAGQTILEDGGNAFDAIVAATWAACICEPILASPAGGGFLMAETTSGQTQLFDFFSQTPGRHDPNAQDFFAIQGNFGSTHQEFHIGMGACAVPGVVAGLFKIQKELCTRPMNVLIQPALDYARAGVEINPFQLYIQQILQPILTANPCIESIFSRPDGSQFAEGDRQYMTELADFLDSLSIEGEALFYQGEPARKLDQLSQEKGGHIRYDDLLNYQVYVTQASTFAVAKSQVSCNTFPSLGGPLIEFSLKLLDHLSQNHQLTSESELSLALAQTMVMTQSVRKNCKLDIHPVPDCLETLSLQKLASDISHVLNHHSPSTRGTTHLSVVDKNQNLAALTLSNGECNGYVLPGTGVLLNNMLGEEDLNPLGFNAWHKNSRLSSMMSPTLVNLPEGDRLALGSGGSNRIRTALTQVLYRILHQNQTLDQAVCAPRLHLEAGQLHLETGFQPATYHSLNQTDFTIQNWPDINLFFGGVHAVQIHPDNRFSGVGDPRRGGVCLSA